MRRGGRDVKLGGRAVGDRLFLGGEPLLLLSSAEGEIGAQRARAIPNKAIRQDLPLQRMIGLPTPGLDCVGGNLDERTDLVFGQQRVVGQCRQAEIGRRRDAAKAMALSPAIFILSWVWHFAHRVASRCGRTRPTQRT